MDFINEYALLFAVAVPVAIVVGMNVVLAVSGESGTLLLPSLKPFPSVPMPMVNEIPESIPTCEVEVAAANSAEVREAS